MKIDLSFWKNASTRRKRIYSAIFVFVVAFLLVIIGSLIPTSHQNATQLVNQVNQTVNQNKASGTIPQFIFLNNFRICLFFFIPVGGPLFSFISFITTGYIIGAESQVFGISPLVYAFFELLNPVFWIEFIAYSIAISESIWLFRRLTQKRYRELKNTAILIGVCAALLAIGAIVESLLPLI